MDSNQTKAALTVLLTVLTIFNIEIAAAADRDLPNLPDNCSLSFQKLLTNRLASINQAVSNFFSRDGFQAVKSLEEAEAIAIRLGVRQTVRFQALDPRKRLKLLNSVLKEVSKIPAAVRADIEAAGKRMDLVLDNVTTHDDLAYLRGIPVEKWSSKTGWENVPGAGCGSGSCTVIAANSLHKNHGSVNLILHEHFHTYDAAAYKLRKTGEAGYGISRSPEFLALHARTKWLTSYSRDYPEEAFVESLASYFHSPRTRATLRLIHPEIYRFIQQNIPQGLPSESYRSNRLQAPIEE